MAQYYQILGPSQPMTIEELHRLNLCVDASNTFILNADEQAYGGQQVILSGDQTHGIIVNGAPDADPNAYAAQYVTQQPQQQPQQPAQPQQHEPQQSQTQSAAPSAQSPHHQVYFTGEQVVLQQGQQIIDPSILTHQIQHHPQMSPHSLLQLHAIQPGIMQHQQTLHYVDQRIQNPQIQQHQIQQQHLQQQQQQQQQQLQQQQLQQHQLQLQQQQQQQLQQQLLQQQQQQQQMPRRQSPIQQQQMVRQQSPIRQQLPRGQSPIQHQIPRQQSPIRPPTPIQQQIRTPVQQSPNAPQLQRPIGHRMPGNMAQPRPGMARPPRPRLQFAQRPNKPAPPPRSPAPIRGAVRPPRPQIQTQEAVSPARGAVPATQAQIQSIPLPQQNRPPPPIRFNAQQPPPTVPKKSPNQTIGANNPGELADLEESIAAAVLPKNPNNSEGVKQESFTIPQTQQPNMVQQQRQNVQQNHMIHINQSQPTGHPQLVQTQQQTFGHPQQQQTPPVQRQQQFANQNQVYRAVQSNQHPNMYSGEMFLEQGHQQIIFEQPNQISIFEGLAQEVNEDNLKVVQLSDGRRMTMGEYKKLHLSGNLRQPSPPNRGINRGGRGGMVPRQMMMARKQDMQTNPVQLQLSPPRQICIPEVDNGIQSDASEPQSARMLILLQSGEQRLITFTLPKESCTVQELLEQVNVPFSADSHIQCIANMSPDIDYFVSVGSPTKMEEFIDGHPMIGGESSSMAGSNDAELTDATNSSEASPEKAPCPPPPAPPQPPPSPPPRYIDGMLALCKICGYTGQNFNKCQRCKRKFIEEPKAIPYATNKKSDNNKKETKEISVDSMKLNLLKKAAKIQYDKKPKNRRPKAKHVDQEPVILTLSSDDEDSNSSFQNQSLADSIAAKEPPVCSKEPTIKEIRAHSTANPIDAKMNEEVKMNDPFVTMKCRTVRIGSHKFTPKQKVIISPKGIRLWAPLADNAAEDVELQLKPKDIVKVLVQPAKTMPVVFVYLNLIGGQYVRRMLNMSEESGPFYNPASPDDLFRRITLLPDVIAEEHRNSLKTLFAGCIDELNTKEANDILMKTCPKDVQQTTKMLTRASCAPSPAKSLASSDPIRQILIYPPGKGGISINTEDYTCLAQDQFLNDVIIDFYLKYLCHDVLTPEQKEKTHVFSTFFYKRLTTKPNKANRSHNHEWDSSLTPAQKRHARVKSWTKNVNLFEKDYIVVPINENCHWFLAIICFPSLDGCRSMVGNKEVTLQDIKKKEKKVANTNNLSVAAAIKQELALNNDGDNLSERDEAEADESDMDMLGSESDEEDSTTPVENKDEEEENLPKTEPIKQPCILIFDSLAGASRSRVVATLRDYLTCEYHAKVKNDKVFTKDTIKGSCPKIPQQNNFTDCGLYLLQYVEYFFKQPINDYHLPIKQLTTWFEEIVVTRKREEISNLLKELVLKNKGDISILPEITFPTLNGKLIESDVENGDEGDAAAEKENNSSRETTVSPRPIGSIVAIGHIITTTTQQSNSSDNNDSASVRKTMHFENVSIPIIKCSNKVMHIANKGPVFVDNASAQQDPTNNKRLNNSEHENMKKNKIAKFN